MTTFDRRSVLGATAVATMTPMSARAAPYDFAKTLDIYRAYSRMRGGGDGVLGLWWYTGNVWLQAGDRIAQLVLTIDGFSFQRLTVQPDGSMIQLMSEAGYFKDPATGKIVDTWINPLNGETCKPRHYKAMQTIVATPEGGLKGNEGGGMRPADFKGAIGPAAINGDQLWIGENFAAKFILPKRDGMDPKEDVGDFLADASLAMFTAKLSDVENQGRDFVPCTLHFQTMNGWMPWMRMGRTPGAQSWQLYGHKVKDTDAIPAALRARFERDYPGWLDKPGI